jgi:hypothetical protein
MSARFAWLLGAGRIHRWHGIDSLVNTTSGNLVRSGRNHHRGVCRTVGTGHRGRVG